MYSIHFEGGAKIKISKPLEPAKGGQGSGSWAIAPLRVGKTSSRAFSEGKQGYIFNPT